MADVVEASSLVVQIAPAWVRVPAVAATKMDLGMTTCTGHEWKTSSYKLNYACIKDNQKNIKNRNSIPMGLAQYNSLGEYGGLSTASFVFLILALNFSVIHSETKWDINVPKIIKHVFLF